MTHFSACTGCAVPTSECETLATLKAAIKGLHITAVRHRCVTRQPRFTPGQAVWIKTFACRDSADEDGPPICWFPGIFVRQKESRAVAFIAPGALEEDGTEGHDYAFETDGRGFVKVPLSRMRPRVFAARVPVEECPACGDIPTLTGCGQTRDYPRCALAEGGR